MNAGVSTPVFVMNIPEEAMSRYSLKGAVSSFNKAVMERFLRAIRARGKSGNFHEHIREVTA